MAFKTLLRQLLIQTITPSNFFTNNKFLISYLLNLLKVYA